MTDSTEDELTSWRRAILSPLAGVCALLSVVGDAGLIVTPALRAHLPDAQIDIFALMSLVLCGLALWRARSILLRCALVALVSIAFCCNIVLYGAFAVPGTYVGLLLLIVMVTLICGQRVAWGALAVTVLGLAIVATYHVRGWVPAQGGLLESQVAINWVTVVGIFALASLGAIGAVSFLLEKLEAELRSSRSLTATVNEQSRTAIEALTKQHELERRLVQGQKTEALGKLAGGVAHDFNNLLTIIMTSMRLAQDRTTDATTRELVQDAQEAASRAATLTSDLLAFSRQQVVEQVSSNVAVATTQLVRLIRRLVPATISVEVAELDETLWVDIAQIELDQILLNLTINARDSMPNGGTIVLRIKRETDMVCISVRDTGAGMDAATVARIFEPFFTTKRPGEGTGLGLAVVQSIITGRGGSIRVESALGAGTEFRVYLPVGEASQAKPPAKTVSATATQKILIVEDEPAVRRMLQRVCEGAGYGTVACESGEKALLALAEHHDIALIVTDVIMPGMDGRTFHDRVVASEINLPFLFCSGYTSTLLTDDVLRLPGRDFLAKPFLPDALLGKVRSLIGKR